MTSAATRDRTELLRALPAGGGDVTATQITRDEWAAGEGLRQSHATTDPVRWLLGGRSPNYSAPPRWMDHGTRWTRDGKPYCLVGQPYQLLDDDLEELARLAELGLDVSVATYPAWHYPGHVLSVVVTRRDSDGVVPLLPLTPEETT